MGKDVRGIERGKCACGECEDFMRSDGATCGYCGCLPTRHCKKDARYSSDSGGSSGAGASQSATSPEKWKDEDLGWFPNPKGEYTEFSNCILPKFYLSFWATCPYKERFRRCFVTERKRQWEAPHFQLDDHIPTMVSFQTSIISLGVQPPPMAVSRTTSSLELRSRDCLRRVN